MAEPFIRPGCKVCIVGAGSIGLYAAKWCLQMGYEPCVYEKATSVGGVWRQDDPSDPSKCHGSAYDSLCTNSSWELMAASDFPFPFQTSGDFPMHHEICRYVKAYCDRFMLWKFMHFNTTVDHITPAGLSSEGEAEGWEVTVMPQDAPGAEMHYFDAVIVASGQFWSPSIPVFAGQDDFAGTIQHSHLYRNPHNLSGKNVLVVGVGNSALDISMEVAKSDAASVRVSSRSGTAVLPVSDSANRPVDRIMSTRLMTYGLPKTLSGLWMLRHIAGTNRSFHDAGLLKQDPTSVQTHFSNVKEHHDYCSKLAEGRLSFVPGVERLSARRAHFADGTSVDCDEIICCTGYDLDFPFLGADLLHGVLLRNARPYHNNTVKTTTWLNTYKHIMHPKHRSLCFLGIINTFGNEAAVGEMQARWMLSHWSGRVAMPTREAVDKYCAKKALNHADRKPNFAGFEPYVQYMDALAEDIGCMPDVPSMPPLVTGDLALWYSLWMGPNVPSVYRLQGPDAWDGAAEYVKSIGRVKPWHFFAFPPGVPIPSSARPASKL